MRRNVWLVKPAEFGAGIVWLAPHTLTHCSPDARPCGAGLTAQPTATTATSPITNILVVGITSSPRSLKKASQSPARATAVTPAPARPAPSPHDCVPVLLPETARHP